MAIHNNQILKESLTKIRVEREPGASSWIELTRHPTPLYLIYAESNLKLDSILNLIIKELIRAGCTANREIALWVLALSIESRPTNTDAIDWLNTRLSSVINANLHLAIITARRSDSPYYVRIGKHQLKLFDPKSFDYWGKRTSSGFPIMFENFRNHIALQSDPLELILVNWNDQEIIGNLLKKWSSKEIMEQLLDAYYYAVFSGVVRKIGPEISAETLVLEAASMASDLSCILTETGSTKVGLFVMNPSTGWALMDTQRVLVANTIPDSLYKRCENWLVQELGFSKFDPNRPIDGMAQKFAEFLRRAQKHRLNSHYAEAFLHFIISLELIFGERTSLADAVSSRTATVTHQALGIEWAPHRKRIQQLYDSRSKYVHEGVSPNENDLREAERICLEVLWVLLRICGRADLNSELSP